MLRNLGITNVISIMSWPLGTNYCWIFWGNVPYFRVAPIHVDYSNKDEKLVIVPHLVVGN